MKSPLAALMLLLAAIGAANAAGPECKVLETRKMNAVSGIDKPMTFGFASSGGNCMGCAWIAAQGEIKPETAKDFETFIRCTGEPAPLQAVRLNSRGGDLQAALALGRLFRKHGMAVYVESTEFRGPGDDFDQQGEGTCEGACFYAFLGGKARYVYNETKLSVRTLGPDVPANPDAQAIVHYLLDMDVPVKAVFRKPSGSVRSFDPEAAAQEGIANGEPRKGDWSLAAAGGALRLTRTVFDPLWGDTKIAVTCRSGQGWIEIEKQRMPNPERFTREQLETVTVGLDARAIESLHKRQGFTMRERDGAITYALPLRGTELDDIAKAETFAVSIDAFQAALDASVSVQTSGREIAQEIQAIRKTCGSAR